MIVLFVKSGYLEAEDLEKLYIQIKLKENVKWCFQSFPAPRQAATHWNASRLHVQLVWNQHLQELT